MPPGPAAAHALLGPGDGLAAAPAQAQPVQGREAGGAEVGGAGGEGGGVEEVVVVGRGGFEEGEGEEGEDGVGDGGGGGGEGVVVVGGEGGGAEGAGGWVGWRCGWWVGSGCVAGGVDRVDGGCAFEGWRCEGGFREGLREGRDGGAGVWRRSLRVGGRDGGWGSFGDAKGAGDQVEFWCYCGGGLERGGGASVGDGGEEGHGVVL